MRALIALLLLAPCAAWAHTQEPTGGAAGEWLLISLLCLAGAWYVAGYRRVWSASRIGRAMLARRGVLFALVSSPYLVVAVQVLDGVCAAILGVILPLVVADVMRGTGRFNLGLGIVGSAVGIGAALSTTLAGFIMDRFGSSPAFWTLAGVAVCGLALVWLLLPETRTESAPTPALS